MKSTNRLAGEQSPYLLQHKHNPVDWYPWGDEAFERAVAEDKPIFLSIGYSTCHWCHVMERESFEDADVAALMNETFVSVKVDREERPDIDNIYMSVCQIMGGHCGWPLNVLLTPELKPFHVATYIPKETRFGRVGMLDFVPRIRALWAERRDDVAASAEEVTGALHHISSQPTSGEGLPPELLRVAYNQLAQRFDTTHGGFGDAPKFPSPHNLMFLLRYSKREGGVAALNMVVQTLEHMRRGGIYDHLGYGFHRYSTDARWLLPHFEKMLYDQAMLVRAYAEAYKATGNAAFEQTAREVITYVHRDMRSPEGGFYSAEDADSEGREGTFYLWTPEQVREVLGEELAGLFIRRYNFEPGGNFAEEATRERTGENIPNLRGTIQAFAEQEGIPVERLEQRMQQARLQLFEAREEREHPYKDDKILTDWNGLMVASLAYAGSAFQDRTLVEAAEQTAGFLLGRMRRPDGRLLHRYRNGEAAIDGNLDDYAFVVWGLIELYQATFKEEYLEAAVTLNGLQLAYFWDERAYGFFFTPSDGEALLVRTKELYDGALPSGNSISLWNLLRLGHLTGDAELEQRAAELGRYAATLASRLPSGFTGLLLGHDFAVGPSYEVVIAGQQGGEDAEAMLAALRKGYYPNMVVLFRPEEEDPAIIKMAPYTTAQRAQGGEATAYVCRSFICNQPTTDIQVMLAQLQTSPE